MKNLRNKNHPPTADLVQVHLESSYDVVRAVYDALPILENISDAIDNGDLDDFLSDTDIDTLAKLNVIVTDANMGDRSEFATAAQGALADTAIQGPFATQGEAEAGTDNTKAMTPLRVAQALAALSENLLNNYDAVTDPGVTDDAAAGYSAGSVWINTASNESWRCSDPTNGAAVWIKTTLTADELATVALTGNSDDLTEGATKLLMTVAERVKLASVETDAKDDQTGPEIKALYEAESNTNAFTDPEKAALAVALLDSDFVASDGMLIKTGAETYSIVKLKLDGTTAPVAGDDSNLGYTPGSYWIDETNDKGYLCVDATVGAAIWLDLTAAGGAGGFTVVHAIDDVVITENSIVFVHSAVKAITVTLIATPSDNAYVGVFDAGKIAGTNNITCARNGETIDGVAEDFVIDQDNGKVEFSYYGTGSTWKSVPRGTPDLVNVADYIVGIQTERIYPWMLYQVTGETTRVNIDGRADALRFAPTGYNWAPIIWAFPKRWNQGQLRFRMTWVPSTTNTGNIQFSLNLTVLNESDDLSGLTLSNNGPSLIDTALGVANDIQHSDWSPWTDIDAPNALNQYFLRFQGQGSAGPYTFTGQCDVLYFEFQWISDAVNDD